MREGSIRNGRPRGGWRRLASAGLLAVAFGCVGAESDRPEVRILNVSYDPTRGLYRAFNASFAEHWEATRGVRVRIDQSHGGSGAQARAVISGLDADVVTLAVARDIDQIARSARSVREGWRDALPLDGAPYASTIVLLVRAGNPMGIRDWEDLARPGIRPVLPNPKTSGVARWAYLALWGSVLHRELGPEGPALQADPERIVEVAAADSAARAFVTRVLRNVPVLDGGARAATNTFLQRGIGDVLLTWENEAMLALERLEDAPFEIVRPSVSIRAEPVVAVVDATADRRGTREVAEAYLLHLYSPEGQEIVARHHFRPMADPDALARYRDRFPPVDWFTIDAYFGGWDAAHARHFAEGGEVDRILQAR